MGAKCRMSGMHFRGGGGASWDGDDYHANYSAFEQFALCAHHSRSTSALGPAVDVCFSAIYFSTLVRDIGGDEESNAEVPALHFDSGKFGVGLEAAVVGWAGVGLGRKCCCTSYTLSIPSPFSLLLSLAPLSIKEIGLKVEQISVIFISQLGEGWLRPGLFFPLRLLPVFFVFPPFSAHLYALGIF